MVLVHIISLMLRVTRQRSVSVTAFQSLLTIAIFSSSVSADDGAQHPLLNLSEAELKEAKLLDWVPVAELTEAQKKEVPITCCGAYIAPTRTDADAMILPEQASVRATADESLTEQQARHSMKGKVAIIQGHRSVSADNANVNQDTRQAELSGNIILREPGFLFRADMAKMDMDTGAAQLDNAAFVLYETRVHGEAAHLQRFGDNVINLEQSRISSCEPGDNTWSMEGSQITIHQNQHYGTAKNMRINIKDVPVLYMPYARFPVGNERLTGFLFPLIGQSSRNGFELAAPFYWNIAPNYDATITPRYMSERGAVFEMDARHMATAFDTEISGSVINNDRGGYSASQENKIKNGTIEAIAYPFRGQDRWVYDVKQEGGRGQAWSSKIHYTDMSDNDFLRDMNNGAVDANRQAYVQQLASLDYRTEHWFIGAKANEYRLLTDSQLPYRELPRVHLNGDYRLNDWLINLNNEYVSFTKNRYFNGVDDDIIYGERVNTDYRLMWDKSFAWGFIKPGVAVKSLTYQLNEKSLIASADNSPAFVVPQTSLDTGLYFERDATLFGDNFLQTFEPRAFYFYSGYKNQDSLNDLTANQSYVNFDTNELTFNYNQLFRTSRFAGGDRIDDANQVSLALSSALVSQMSGLERLRVSLGQIYYAEDRKITSYDSTLTTAEYLREANSRGSSPLALQLSSHIGQSLQISADVAYDQRDQQLRSASTGIHYMDDQYRLFNLAYRYTLDPLITSPSQPPSFSNQSLKQIDVSILWPVSSRWSVVARSNYDFNYGVELDTFAGFEYNDCCYRVRLMGRHWLKFDYNSPAFLQNVTQNDYESGISIELQLKGLGSTGQGISKLLDKAVAGFSDREKNLR